MIIKLIKKPDDPLCCRASCGGSESVEGYYCVFRGNKEEIVKCLEVILEAFKSGQTIQVEND